MKRASRKRGLTDYMREGGASLQPMCEETCMKLKETYMMGGGDLWSMEIEWGTVSSQ